jgi:predicted enzyme related to lactoylglutathione lyase
MEMGKWGAGGALVKMDGVSSGGNSTIIYFSCEDCAVEQDRIIAAGGKIHKEKWSIGEYGFIALVFDSEDNMIGLHSLK